MRFGWMPSERYDSVEMPPLIDGIVLAGLITDKAFNSNALVAELNNRDLPASCPRAEAQD